jgi:hypothetical protein
MKLAVWFRRKLRLAGFSRRAGLKPSSKRHHLSLLDLVLSLSPFLPSPFARLTVPAHFLGRVTLGLTFCVIIKTLINRNRRGMQFSALPPAAGSPQLVILNQKVI